MWAVSVSILLTFAVTYYSMAPCRATWTWESLGALTDKGDDVCNFTASVFNSAECEEKHSFTLSNGKLVNQSSTFCECIPERIRQKRLACDNLALEPMRRRRIPIPTCNTDGTWFCARYLPDTNIEHICINNQGKENSAKVFPQCEGGAFCQPACIRYSKQRLRFENAGKCTCTVARSQYSDTTDDPTKVATYVPKCSADGSWAKTQTGYHAQWSMDTSGNQIGGFLSA